MLSVILSQLEMSRFAASTVIVVQLSKKAGGVGKHFRTCRVVSLHDVALDTATSVSTDSSVADVHPRWATASKRASRSLRSHSLNVSVRFLEVSHAGFWAWNLCLKDHAVWNCLWFIHFFSQLKSRKVDSAPNIPNYLPSLRHSVIQLQYLLLVDSIGLVQSPSQNNTIQRYPCICMHVHIYIYECVCVYESTDITT